MSNRTALVLRLPEEVSVECLVDTILERDLRQRKDNEAKKESQAKSTVLFQFFWQKVKVKAKGAWVVVALCEDCTSQGNSVMLNNACAYLGAFPLVGAQTKQESISPQPGCLFSQNCRNLIPLETSVPQSDLPRIDQQIQRSPGSIKHEHTNLISSGNWGEGNKAFFAQFPIRTY